MELPFTLWDEVAADLDDPYSPKYTTLPSGLVLTEPIPVGPAAPSPSPPLVESTNIARLQGQGDQDQSMDLPFTLWDEVVADPDDPYSPEYTLPSGPAPTEARQQLTQPTPVSAAQKEMIKTLLEKFF